MKTVLGLRVSHPAHLSIGLTVWCLWFVAVYGGLSVACALAAPDPGQGAVNPINLGLGLLTLLTTAGLGYLAFTCWQLAPAAEGDSPERQGRFFARLSAALYFLAGGATLAVGLPILALPPCI